MARMSLKSAVEKLDVWLVDGYLKDAWKVARASIKEARPTVRAKRPVQQLKAEIAAALREHLSHCNTVDFGSSHVVLMDKLRQLSAV